MNQRETRRINPVAHVTACAVGFLIVFECLVMLGVLELRAQTVAKYAPWAFEPFLRLVGEHPESMPRWASVEEAETKETSESVAAEAAGLEFSSIPLLVGTNEPAVSTNAVPETNLPVDPATSPAEIPESKPEAIVPVG